MLAKRFSLVKIKRGSENFQKKSHRAKKPQGPFGVLYTFAILKLFWAIADREKPDYQKFRRLKFRRQKFRRQKFPRQKFRRQKFRRQKFRRQKFRCRKLRSIKRRILLKLLGIV